MISSLRQAEAIQARRVTDGKRGLSRAVRRYITKLATTDGKFEWYRYNDIKQDLPQIPIIEVQGNV